MWLFCLFYSYYDLCLCSDIPSHTAAVIAAVLLLLLLAVAAVVYSRCHLNIKLWYRNSYGDYELNGETDAEVLLNTKDDAAVKSHLYVCVSLCHQTGNYMTPTSPMWATTMTGSLSTLFSNLTWKIKVSTKCISMTMTSYLVEVSLNCYFSFVFNCYGNILQNMNSQESHIKAAWSNHMTVPGYRTKPRGVLFSTLVKSADLKLYAGFFMVFIGQVKMEIWWSRFDMNIYTCLKVSKIEQVSFFIILRNTWWCSISFTITSLHLPLWKCFVEHDHHRKTFLLKKITITILEAKCEKC